MSTSTIKPGPKGRVVQIAAGNTYIFAKSGNEVRAIAPAAPYQNLPMWEVERTRGASAGKRMLVPAGALY